MTPDNVIALTKLTETQRRVMDLSCRGYTNRQISQKLGIGISTVTTATTNIKRKLGIVDEGHRKLVHWYWACPGAPGYTELKVKILEGGLREMTETANRVMLYNAKLKREGAI